MPDPINKPLPTKKVPPPLPADTYAPLSQLIVSGLKAMQAGEASAHQQKQVLQWIIEEAAWTYMPPYRNQNARDTDFALGRAFVGHQIVRALNLNLAKFIEKENKQ